MKIAIITTHPIQYNAPWFSLLSQQEGISIKVFYTWGQSGNGQNFDPGFGKHIKWDIPLLEGYNYTFVNNTSKQPGSHHFWGIVNPGLITFIEDFNPDAILVFGWAFSSHLACIRYFYKKKIILFRGDSTLLDEKKNIKTLIRRIFLRWVYRHIDYALYVGKNNKEYFLVNGLRQNQLLYAPHAVDNNRFASPENLYHCQADAMKNQLGIGADEVVLLFAGKLETKKNPFFLIQLLQKHNSPKLKVLFVGNGKSETALKKMAANDKRILFLDFQNQQKMPVIYRLADILILPSNGPGETWGMVLNEAMACGIAVAASNKTGAAADLIVEGKNGVVINFENITSINNLIESALKDKTILKKMGKESFSIISNYRYENIVNSIVSVSNNIII